MDILGYIDELVASGSVTAFYVGAFIMGAFHALEPGHGKTVVAAYLVGSKGKVYEAVFLGLVVTFTHTFSVLILAVVAKVLAADVSEAALHTYMGFVAAGLILIVGVWMMVNRWNIIKGRSKAHSHGHPHGHSHAASVAHSHHSHDEGHGHHHHHDHDHEHPHSHGHGDGHGHSHEHHGHGDDGHTHGHDHDGHDHEHAPVLEHEWEHEHIHSHGFFSHSHAPRPGDKIGMWSLLLLGISGGIVPCPAALILIPATLGLGLAAKVVSVIVVFSLGLAVTLVVIGITMVKAAGIAGKYMDTERVAPYIAFGSAVLITLIGVVTLINSIKEVVA